MEARRQDKADGSNRTEATAVATAGAPVRGTQTFVGTMSSCWRRPSLTGLEVLWRWSYGVPAAWLVFVKVREVLGAHTRGTNDVALLGLDRALVHDPVGALAADPIGVTGKIMEALGTLWPDLLRLAEWMVPVLVVTWVVVSSLGRTAVLRRAEGALAARPGTLMVLQAVRLAALAASFWVWVRCIAWAARVAVVEPMAAGEEPQLVLYCAVAIVTTIVLFVLWGAVSWVFSVAPLLAMLKRTGVMESLITAVRLGPLKGKLVEINLVLGIVKIALIVLAMVFSATPLPFESVTSPGFLEVWWAGVTVLYFVASDFFHVARLVGYLELWRAFEVTEDSLPERAHPRI